MAKKEASSKNVWAWASVATALSPWAGNFLISLLYPADAENRDEIRQASGIIFLVSVMALIVALTALVKVRGRLKIVVLLTVVPTIFIGYLALFSHTWLS